MPVREDLATVLVRCTGLAMICLNQTEQQGEVGFLRDDKHVLNFKILRPFYRNGSNNLITYREIATYQEFPNENVNIKIEAPGAPAGFQTFRNEDFNRLSDTNDRNDFRWLVNLEEFHEPNTLRPTSQQPFSLSTLKLLNGLFYTHQLDQKLVFNKVRKNPIGANGQPEQFGRVAKTLGARIDGAEVIVRISSNDMEATHSLPRVPGFPSIVEISNVDPDPNARLSDMGDYYKYVNTLGGDEVDLVPITGSAPTDEPGEPTEDGVITVVRGDQVNQQDFCHPVILPLESLSEL